MIIDINKLPSRMHAYWSDGILGAILGPDGRESCDILRDERFSPFDRMRVVLLALSLPQHVMFLSRVVRREHEKARGAGDAPAPWEVGILVLADRYLGGVPLDAIDKKMLNEWVLARIEHWAAHVTALREREARAQIEDLRAAIAPWDVPATERILNHFGGPAAEEKEGE